MIFFCFRLSVNINLFFIFRTVGAQLFPQVIIYKFICEQNAASLNAFFPFAHESGKTFAYKQGCE